MVQFELAETKRAKLGVTHILMSSRVTDEGHNKTCCNWQEEERGKNDGVVAHLSVEMTRAWEIVLVVYLQ